jgi:hypothetical protein
VGRKRKSVATATSLRWRLSEAYRQVIDSDLSRELDTARADFVQLPRLVGGSGLSLEQRAIIDRFEAARFAANKQFCTRMATSYRALGRPGGSANAHQEIPASIWGRMDLTKLSLNMVHDAGGVWWHNVEVEPVATDRAPRRWKLEAVINAMRLKIERRALTIMALTTATEEMLANDYGASRTTVRAARKELISRHR